MLESSRSYWLCTPAFRAGESEWVIQLLTAHNAAPSRAYAPLSSSRRQRRGDPEKCYWKSSPASAVLSSHNGKTKDNIPTSDWLTRFRNFKAFESFYTSTRKLRQICFILLSFMTSIIFCKCLSLCTWMKLVDSNKALNMLDLLNASCNLLLHQNNSINKQEVFLFLLSIQTELANITFWDDCFLEPEVTILGWQGGAEEDTDGSD